jgi:hypothetical protein
LPDNATNWRLSQPIFPQKMSAVSTDNRAGNLDPHLSIVKDRAC